MGQKLTQPEEIDWVLLVEGTSNLEAEINNSCGDNLNRVSRIDVYIPPYRAAYMRSHAISDSVDGAQAGD